MATTTQVAAPPRARSLIASWHLLSLDAPTVAAVWTYFVGRASGVHLPFATVAAMFLAVWVLYVTDRLLDTRYLNNSYDCRFIPDEIEERHLFHHRHRQPFRIGIAVAAVAFAALVPRLYSDAIHLYVAEGTMLVGWFLLLHLSREPQRLPKELAVGIFFSPAIFIPTLVRRSHDLMFLLPSMVLLMVLCTVNCLFIHAWEDEHPLPTRRISPGRNRIGPHLPFLVSVSIVAGTVSALLAPRTVSFIPAACALAFALLLGLHLCRSRLSRIHLRAAADFVLLTPLLLLPFIR